MGIIFPDSAVARFDSAYPMMIARLTHKLVDHPLLTLAALADLAGMMNPDDLEHNRAVDIPLGISNADLPGNDLSTIDTIRTIEANGSWVLLKKVQQVPAYRELLDRALADIGPSVLPRTGPYMRPDAYIFISSPDAITPPHFDPDYNILAQIHGSKTMTVFPAEDTEIVPPGFQEYYFSGGSRNLAWQERWAERGTAVTLHPGDGVYVPILAPHWVKVHARYSISLSLTWRSVWSHHHADACRLNKRLRDIGLRPSPPRLYPRGNMTKSVVYRLIEKVERTLGRSA